MTKKNHKSSRGSTTGRPVMVLFDVLGKRWTMRILWELRDKRKTFRELRTDCDEVSPTLLNQRIKTLREMDILDHDDTGYGLTKWGDELGDHLIELDLWSQNWARR